MIRRSLLAVTISVATIFAGKQPQTEAPAAAAGKQKGEVKADSMVYDEPTEWRVFSVGGAVRAFAVQSDLLWAATESVVSSIGSGKRAELQKFSKLGSMPGEGIVAIVADRQGRVWFGGPAGVAVKSGNQFTNYSTGNGLCDNNVSFITAANDGSVWVGTGNGVSQFQGGSWKSYSTKDGLASDKIQTIMADGRGNVWFGTDKGISVYNGSKWTSHTMKNGMSWNDTKALAFDPKKGVVWAAVGEKDVNSYDGKQWNVFMDIQAGITSIMVDSEGRIWFGSANGLIKFNGDEWISDSKQLGVPAAQVSQVYCDGAGNLWFATENGVVRLANPYPH